MSNPRDPFSKPRAQDGVLRCKFQGETIPMILRHADVRKAGKDWSTYSSDAPFRVPIPSEEEVRSMRQLPIETDPPEHTEFRKIVEPFFKRAKDPVVIGQVDSLLEEMIQAALGGEPIEIVNEFALPIQSRALTYMLNMDEAEAGTWVGWGMKVFRVGGSDGEDGSKLEHYIDAQLELARDTPGDDFFSALTQAEFRGERLTKDQMHGFANLTFAGGRDTVINMISSVISYLAEHPEALDFLREEPKRIVNASEEFFRAISPLTHLGRVCPVATDVHGTKVEPKGRVSLCWASANYDTEAFDSPEEIRLDRKPNPHVAFGAGPHLCLGAPHARLILRSLLKKLCSQVSSITQLDAKSLVEHEAAYDRQIGFDSLTVKFARL